MTARLDVDAALVEQLVAGQFPQWAGLPVRRVAEEGWDNRTFHLGPAMLVRLPSGAAYALAVEKEHRWLPVLAPHLPLPIPVPLARGVPAHGYPYPWSVYSWLDGEPVTAVADQPALARDLAGFLLALRGVDPAGGPGPGLHNWYRGGPLQHFDEWVEGALAAIGDRLPQDLLRQIWQHARGTGWDGRAVWFHGDVAPGNLLLRDGRLGAVIDFGTCGVGDPACDLAIAWTTLDGPGRAAFRAATAVDDDTWTRGRGWALWKTLVEYAAAVGRADAGGCARWRAVLDTILSSWTAGVA